MYTITCKYPWVDDIYTIPLALENRREMVTMVDTLSDALQYTEAEDEEIIMTIKIKKAPTTTQEPPADVPPTSGDDWIVSDKEGAVK